jgi:hypothetical protein
MCMHVYSVVGNLVNGSSMHNHVISFAHSIAFPALLLVNMQRNQLSKVLCPGHMICYN